MDTKTREALEASIKHWEQNVAAGHPGAAKVGPGNCALCEAFHEAHCDMCPVRLETGAAYCHRTPYSRTAEAIVRWRWAMGDPLAREAWRKAAQAELDFLISLRPEVEA